MTFREAAEVVAKVTFCGLFRDSTVEVRRDCLMDSVTVWFTMQVPDRDTGKPIQVNSARAISLPMLERMPQSQLVDMIQSWFRNFVRHEAEEALLFEGRRLCDPHANERAA